MSKWKSVLLSECCEIVSGATPSTTISSYWGGDICWATPKDLSGLDGHYISDTPRKLTRDGLASCAAAILPANSVLFSSRAPIGHVAINTVPMATNQGFKSFVPRKDLIDSKFLFHWLRANREFLEGLGNGATFKEVSKATVAQIAISIPSVAEQRRIAAILDKADALRVKRREVLRLLDSFAASIFIGTFGDPATNPLGLPAKTLGELIQFEGGAQPPATSFSDDDGPEKIRLVQIRDFKSDRFKTFVPRSLAKRHFEVDDVMIGRYGPPVFQILRGLSGSYNVALVKAVPKEGITKDFVFYLLREKKLHSFVVANSERTAGQSGVNLELLERYQAYKPSVELQEAFTRKIAVLGSLKKHAAMSLTHTESMFRSLQHRAFTGTQ